jgi:hypothetical protein
MSVFGIRRAALRLAKEAGFTRARNDARRYGARRWTPPSDGVWRRASPLAPYWWVRCGETALDSHEITDDEHDAFNVQYLFVHFERDSRTFHYTNDAVESEECAVCSTRTPIAGLTQVYRRTARRELISAPWCEACRDDGAFYCGEVAEYVHNDWAVIIQDTDDVVAAWWAEDNAYHHSDGYWYSEPEDDESDDESDDDESDDGAGLFAYGTNVLSKHPWPDNAPKDALLFGVELEVEGNENRRSEQRSIAEALGGSTGSGLQDGAYILAHDGSLNNGVEIITVPQTFEHHKAETVVPWKKISAAIRGIAKSGNTKTCGMHVHINRAALTPLQVGKMLVFLNSNATTRLVEQVAQRSGEQWAKRAPKSFADGLPARVREFGHYDALGYSSKGTMELRIFRGNTRHDRIMKNIEFTHAMCEFARLESMRDMEQPAKFLAFIGRRERTYPNLCKFLDAHVQDNATVATEE